MLVVEKGKCREERWYNFTPTPFRAKEETEAARELLELYKGAVRRHLLSDVPVGILLSGGLDSGLLLALMNEQGGPWPAYTIGYGDTYEDDELLTRRKLRRCLGARHITVRLDQSEFERSCQDRGMSGGTDRSFLHRSDVLCFPAGAPGC